MTVKRNIRRDANLDFQDIGLRIASIMGQYFLKTEHLHYGYWTPEMEVDLANLPKAQQNYTEFLKSHIPAGVKTILDVGCGTGHNASILLDCGYQVDCVSPSDSLSDATKNSLSGRGQLYESTFEALDIKKKYDCILFSESFQYIKLDSAFDNMKRYLNDNGVVVIADFFRIPAEGSSPLGGGHRLSRFQEALEKSPFKVLTEEDITDNTAPNLQLVDEVLQQVAIPSKDLVFDALKGNYPISFKIVSFIANMFFAKRLKKLNFKYFSGERNAENFKKFKRYFLFVLQ